MNWGSGWFSRKHWAVVAALAASVVVLVVTVGSGSAASPPVQPCTPNPVGGTGYWTPFGNGTWTAQGLQTTSQADPSLPYGVTCGGASVYGSALPTTDPSQITALSFDFFPDRSGPSGGSPRLVVCFSDSNGACDSNGALVPTQWAAQTWIHVDGFSPATGLNATWSNNGGTCGGTTHTTWSAIVACHPGATITTVAVVNDSGSLYTAGEQVLLNNFRVNGVFAHAAPPEFDKLAEIAPIVGHVKIMRPGSHHFRKVKTVSRVPFGTIVDATRGRVQVIAAKRGRHTESGAFYAGSFRLTQERDGVVQATLTRHPSCASKPLAAHTASGSAPRLWGRVRGRYRTRGSYGSASVRGTIWLTEERCAGTYFRVLKGVLFIRDFTRHKHVILRAGHSYLAPR